MLQNNVGNNKQNAYLHPAFAGWDKHYLLTEVLKPDVASFCNVLTYVSEFLEWVGSSWQVSEY